MACCAAPTITPSTLVDQTYRLSTVAATYQVPLFTTDVSCCAASDLTYTYTVSPPNPATLTINFDADPVSATPLEFSWQSQTLADIITTGYTITVTATAGCSTAQVSFVLMLEDPCINAVLAIDADHSTFLDPLGTTSLTQIVHHVTQQTLSWDDTEVSTDVDPVFTHCGDYVWTLTDTSGGAIDTTLFNFVDVTGGTNTLELEKDDPQYSTQSYNLRVGVQYASHTASFAFKDFTVDIVNSCKTATLTVDGDTDKFISPAVTQDVFNPTPGSISWPDSEAASTVTDTNIDCGPIVWTLTDTSGNALDATVFTESLGTAPYSLDVQTDDISKAMTYNLRVKAQYQNYPAATDPIGTKDFTVVIRDECETAVLTPPADIAHTYNIGYAADTQTAFGAFTGAPSYCTYTYSLSWSPTPASTTWLSLDDATRVFTVGVLTDLTYAGVYTVTVTAITPQGTTTTYSFDNVLTLEDPCVAATLTIASTIVSANPVQQAILATVLTEALSDTHVTSDETTATCPAIELNVIERTLGHYDNAVFTWSPPNFRIQTDDFAKLTGGNGSGLYEFQITAKYIGAAYSVAGSFDFDVQLTNPCDTPNSLTANTQTNPADYSYDGTQNQFSLTAFTVDPVECLPFITYSCAPASGPDICAVSTTGTTSNFDTATGNWDFTSDSSASALANCPPGDYPFVITASLGTGPTTAAANFQATLCQPCDQASLTFTAVVTDQPQSQTYTLRDPDKQVPITESSLITGTTANCDCGAYAYTVENSDGSALDATLFDYTAGTLTVLQTSDESKAMVYNLQMKVYLALHPTVSVTHPFTVTIVDPCDAPVSLSAGALVDQVYKVTAATQSYQFAAFTPDPAWCEVTYTYTVSGAGTSVVNSFDGSDAGRTFKFYTADLSLAGAFPTLETDYTVTVTGQTGNDTPQTDSGTFVLKVQNPCDDNSLTKISQNGQLTTISYLISDTETITDPLNTYFKVTPSFCGPLQLSSTFNTDPTILSASTTPISFDGTDFTVFESDVAFFGSHLIKMTATLQNYAVTNALTLELPLIAQKCPIGSIAYSPIADVEYTIGDAEIKFAFEEPVAAGNDACGFVWTYAAHQLDDSGNQVGQIDTDGQYVSFDPATREFKIHNTDGSPQAINVELVADFSSLLHSLSVPFTVTIKETAPLDTFFVDDNLKPIITGFSETMGYKFDLIDSGTSSGYEIQVGEIIDEEGDSVELEFINSLPFITYDKATNKILVLPDASVGNYTVKIELHETRENDDANTERDPVVYTINIEIADPTLTETEESEQGIIVVVSGGVEIDRDGVKLRPPPTFEIIDVSNLGNVTIQFNDSMVIPANISEIDDTVLLVQVLPSPESDPEKLLFNWTVSGFTSEKMYLNLTFEDAIYVSANKGREKLRIMVKEPAYFRSKGLDGNYIKNETFDAYMIPPQLQQGGTAEALETLGEAVGTSLESGFGASFAMNILMAGSLSMLWGMINALQLIAHLPLMAVTFPSNAKVIYKEIYNIATFDLVEVDVVYDAIFEFSAMDAYDENFKELGLETSNPIYNLGPVFLSIVAGLLIILWMSALSLIIRKVKCARMIYEFIKNRIFWNSFIRFALEAYIELAVTNMMKTANLNFSNWSEVFASLFSLVACLVLFILPLWSWNFLKHKYNAINKKDFQQSFGALTLNHKEQKMAMSFHSIFMYRRFCMAAIIVYLNSVPPIQIMALTFKCSIVMILVGRIEPFQGKQFQVMELFNEAILLICIYHLFAFTNFVPDAGTRFTMGWSIIGVTCFSLVVNMGVVMYTSVTKTYRSAKYKIRIRREKKILKKQISDRKKNRMAKAEKNIMSLRKQLTHKANDLNHSRNNSIMSGGNQSESSFMLDAAILNNPDDQLHKAKLRRFGRASVLEEIKEEPQNYELSSFKSASSFRANSFRSNTFKSSARFKESSKRRSSKLLNESRVNQISGIPSLHVTPHKSSEGSQKGSTKVTEPVINLDLLEPVDVPADDQPKHSIYDQPVEQGSALVQDDSISSEESKENTIAAILGLTEEQIFGEPKNVRRQSTLQPLGQQQFGLQSQFGAPPKQEAVVVDLATKPKKQTLKIPVVHAKTRKFNRKVGQKSIVPGNKESYGMGVLPPKEVKFEPQHTQDSFNSFRSARLSAANSDKTKVWDPSDGRTPNDVSRKTSINTDKFLSEFEKLPVAVKDLIEKAAESDQNNREKAELAYLGFDPETMIKDFKQMNTLNSNVTRDTAARPMLSSKQNSMPLASPLPEFTIQKASPAFGGVVPTYVPTQSVMMTKGQQRRAAYKDMSAPSLSPYSNNSNLGVYQNYGQNSQLTTPRGHRRNQSSSSILIDQLLDTADKQNQQYLRGRNGSEDYSLI